MVGLEEKRFLSLLRSGIWNVKADLSLFCGAKVDWDYIFRLSSRHSVTAWVYDGIEMLPPELKPSGRFMLKWFSVVMRIEAMNRKINSGIADIARLYAKNNIDWALFKGQSLATLYPNPLHRQPGDIDGYIGRKNYNKANCLLETIGGRRPFKESSDDKHVHFEWNGLIVENHIDMVRFSTKSYSEAWDRFLYKHFNNSYGILDFENLPVNVPSAYFNSIYLIVHIIQHLIADGIGLRQICDFMTVIKNSPLDFDNEQWTSDIKSLGLERVYGVMACIGNKYFGLEKSKFPFYSEEYAVLADYLIEDILEGGNFGKEWQNRRFVKGGRFKRNIYLLKWVLGRYRFVRKIYPVESFNRTVSIIKVGIKHNFDRLLKCMS